MVLQGRLATAGDEDELLDAGRARLLDRVLDERLVDHRQHLLGHRLGRREKARAKAADRKDRFADGSRHQCLFLTVRKTTPGPWVGRICSATAAAAGQAARL